RRTYCESFTFLLHRALRRPPGVDWYLNVSRFACAKFPCQGHDESDQKLAHLPAGLAVERAAARGTSRCGGTMALERGATTIRHRGGKIGVMGLGHRRRTCLLYRLALRASWHSTRRDSG